MLCFNCDKLGAHRTRDCDKPMAECDICGPKAGHLPKHCLIKSSKPAPSSWPTDRKEGLSKQRQAFKAGGAPAVAALGAICGATVNYCTDCDPPEPPRDEAFWDLLRNGYDGGTTSAGAASS